MTPDGKSNMDRTKRLSCVLLLLWAGLLWPGLLLAAGPAQEGHDTAAVAPDHAETEGGWARGLGYVGAALAVGLGSVGAGLAVGPAASAAVGAVAEKEETAGKSLVFVGVAEGIAIYGLVIAIMILNRM